MPDYTKLAATAKRLIEASGRTVTFRRLGTQVDDPTKPWRASENVRNPAELEVQAKAVFVDPVSAAKMGLGVTGEEMINKIDSVALVASDSALTFDLETFHEVVETNSLFKIIHVEVLRPGTKKLLYIFLLVSTGVIPSSIFPASLLTNLVAWYRLEGPAGVTWPDAHTGARHLTPSPAPIIAPGKILSGASFTGTQKLTNNSPAFGFVAPFEMAVWAKATALGVDRTVLAKNNAGSVDGWDIVLTAAGTYALSFYSSLLFQFARITSAVPIVVGQMNLIQVWLDGLLQYHIRINNVGEVTTGGFLPTAAPEDFTIGSSSDGTQPFLGVIDEAALWTGNLTEADRAAIYNAGNGLTYP